MALKKNSNYKYTMLTATETATLAWDKLTGTSSNDTLTVSKAAEGTGLVDLGAGTNDWLKLNVANQTWNLQLNGVEKVTATAANTTFNVKGAGVFTTDGSITTINCGSGAQRITFTGASDDSTVNLGDGRDQVYFDGASTQWSYKKTATGAEVYDLNTGKKVTLNGDVEYLKIQNNQTDYVSANTDDVLLSSLSTGDTGGTKVSEAVTVNPITFNSTSIDFQADFGSGQGYAYAYGRIDGTGATTFGTNTHFAYIGGTQLNGAAQSITLDPTATGNYYYMGGTQPGAAQVIDGWLWTYFFGGSTISATNDKLASQGAYRLIVGTDAANTTGAMDQSAGDTMNTGDFVNYYNTSATSGYAMYGFGGNDSIVGGANNDTIWGGTGADSIKGGAGVDKLEGEAGNDVFQYAAASDLFASNALVDSITGGADTDTIQLSADGFTIANTLSFARAATVETLAAGAAAANAISVTLGATAFTAGIRTVTLAADTNATGANTIDMTAQTDNAIALTLTGSAGVDSITGGAGNDTITGGAGVDSLVGGTGNDVFVYDSSAADATGVAETITGGAETADTIVVAGGTTAVDFSDDSITTIDTLELTKASDLSTADNNAQALSLTANQVDGFTTINAAATNITTGDIITVTNAMTAAMLDGTAINGQLVLKASDVASNALTLVDGVLSGTDVLYVDANELTGTNAFNLNANAELDATTAIVFRGGAAADTVVGGAGADTITGGEGADSMAGGTGADTFVFAAGVTDTVAAAASVAGIDKITDLVLNAALADVIDLTVTVANVNTAIAAGSADAATFVADMNTLVNVAGGAGFDTAVNGDISAVLVTLNAGDQTGKTFLLVDLDGSDTFTATDFIIDVTGVTATSFTTASFV